MLDHEDTDSNEENLDVLLIQDAQMELNGERFDAASLGLIADLRNSGFDVHSVEDLRWPGAAESTAFPILAEWLSRTEYLPLKIEIARVLSMPWARGLAVPTLIGEFQRIDPVEDPGPNSARWFLGWGLSKFATDEVKDSLLWIARDTRQGAARFPIIIALGRMKKTRGSVIPFLLEALADPSPDVFVPAAKVLAKWKIGAARPRLESLLGALPSMRFPSEAANVDRPWIRKQLATALVRIIAQ